MRPPREAGYSQLVLRLDSTKLPFKHPLGWSGILLQRHLMVEHPLETRSAQRAGVLLRPRLARRGLGSRPRPAQMVPKPVGYLNHAIRIITPIWPVRPSTPGKKSSKIFLLQVNIGGERIRT
jgi:hypothetical protein